MVRRAFAVAGDAYVEITRGFGEPLSEERPYIPLVRDTELVELAEALLDEVRETTVPAIEQLRQLLEESTALVEDLRDPSGPVQEILAGLNDAIDEINLILNHVSDATVQLPDMAFRVAGELEDLPGLVYQTQATLQEAEVLIEGIQRHWLIRRHIEKAPRPDDRRIPPSALVGAGGVE